MKRSTVAAALWLAATLAVTPTAGAHPRATQQLAYHDRGGDDGGDSGDGGDGYSGGQQDQRHCHQSENCRGSFSPGPFDRSPVDVHDNCVSLDCSGNGGQKKPPPQKTSLACLVPVPFHCDPHPKKGTS